MTQAGNTPGGLSAGSGGERHRVLVAGGGVAAVEAILALRDLAGELVEIELLSRQRELVYRPLAVGEPFGVSRAFDFDLAAVADGARAALRIDTFVEVDPERRSVRTSGGELLSYDSLIVACGALPREGLPGAIHFAGPQSVAEIHDLLNEIVTGRVKKVVFALPHGPSWALPLYELALLTEAWLDAAGIRRPVELTVVTSEDSPLAAFGPAASASVGQILRDRGIEVRAGSYLSRIGEEAVELVPQAEIEADRVITLPGAVGPAIAGLPSDPEGFLPIDEHCAVEGIEGVYAAGDATNFPIKQGGLATEQADVAAEAIAARSGAPVDPKPFDPVLRGVLITGERPEFLRSALRGGHGETSDASEGPLWWPPTKIAGKYLGPYLASIGGEEVRPPGA
jgi:sulfide:quinone oxidoreductase